MSPNLTALTLIWLKMSRLAERAQEHHASQNYFGTIRQYPTGRADGATRLKAITSVGNQGSIAFHRSLGFDAQITDDYNGPGRGPMVVFRRDLPFGP